MADVEGAFNTMVDTIGQPVRSSSLFYTYYYLNEIEDVSEVAADLSRMEIKLHDGFYYYGIMSVFKEIVHAGAKTSVVIEGDEIAIRRARSRHKRKFWELIEDETPRELDPQYIHELLTMKGEPIRMLSTNLTDIKQMLQYGDKNVGILGNPEKFIKSARFIFDGPLTWGDEFGGESWASICDVLLSRDEHTKTTWVDLCWSVEHNSGNWLNKIEPTDDELEMARKITGYDVSEVSDSGMDFVVQDELLEKVLDAKREGDFSEVFPIARRYDSGLSRYRHLLT